MKRSLQLSVAVLLTLSLAGCFNGGGSSSNSSQADFTDFVKAEIDNTANDREPVQINNVEFTFNDQDNEQAYDDLF